MRILVFQHVAIEHPGVFCDFWREAGHEWTAVELDEGEPIPDLEPFDVMAAMGGPMDVWEQAQYPWLADEKAAIRHWVMDLGRPYLGICLGHQLLADAIGGTVGLMADPEVGLAPVALTAAGRADPVMGSLGVAFPAIHWHGAEVSALPPGATALAASSACPIQAMRWGRHAYGIQCHVEVTGPMLEAWAEIPAYRSSLEQTLGVDGAARLLEGASRDTDVRTSLARRINAGFMSLAETR